MPYPVSHRAQTRDRIVASARKLFNRRGFDGVSIEEIMEDAGLTHGGFYRHFSSKSDLYAEVLDCFFTNPQWSCEWKDVTIDRDAADFGGQIVRAYLSNAHLEESDNACPLVALPSDVARAGPTAKRAYQTVFEAMVDVLQRASAAGGSPPRRSALAIAALCVGGMVIARASEDRALSDDLREAARSVALELGGWDHATEPA